MKKNKDLHTYLILIITLFSLLSFDNYKDIDSININPKSKEKQQINFKIDSIKFYYDKSLVKDMSFIGRDTIKEIRWFYYNSSIKNKTKEKFKKLCREKGGDAVLIINNYTYGFGFFYSRTIIGERYKEKVLLTQKQKMSDFEYLFGELKNSYPYFEINKRMNNIDWLNHKEEYINLIRNTKNDKEFYVALNDILKDLNNGHTDTYPTEIYKYFYKAYKGASQEDSSFIPYIKELEKTDIKQCDYWKSLWDKYISEKKPNTDLSRNDLDENSENISTIFIDSLSVGVLRVKSFSYDLVKNDTQLLSVFFNKIFNYKNLIIDIQGNEGGNTGYWVKNIIPYLIKDTISFPMYYAFKNSDRIRYFKPQYFTNIIKYTDIGLPNLPPELENGKFLFRKERFSIYPNVISNKYLGNIYLLVDNKVFSSAETLAYFCKSTNFATVVGEKTNGDGVGTDPLILTLPNSGILVRFTGEMGLNPDGSANDETKTLPDIIIKAKSKDSRLDKLLKQISEM